VEIKGNLVPGRFLARDNRFRVTVEVDGRRVWAHLPNSGRLGELLIPGCPLLMLERPQMGRKTGLDLILVESDGRWVSVDARMPNDLVEEAVRGGHLVPVSGYLGLRREVVHGSSRFDFLLESPGRPPCLVEVKSITLVVDGLGCFPDAITRRGRRHVEELAEAVDAGYRAVVIFCVQREDALGVRPHDESDPEFGRALRDAACRGVEIYAYACHVEPRLIQISHSLPVWLGSELRDGD
jgi:sugar fermentation stimulation protein A